MAKSAVKEYIVQALFDLLKKQELARITVKDITRRAGVCRASFYRNFFTVGEVIDFFLDEAFSQAYPLHSMRADNVDACVLQFFKAAKAHRQELSLLAKRGLLDRVNVAVYRQTLGQILQLQVLQNHYQPHFFSGASAAVLCAWIENDFAESEEQLTNLFMESLRGYMPLTAGGEK